MGSKRDRSRITVSELSQQALLAAPLKFNNMDNNKDSNLEHLMMEKEFERMKADLERFKGELSGMIANAKVDIGDTAIAKMAQAFTFFKAFALGASALVLTLFGAGYFSAQSTAQKFIESKLNDWMSVDRKGAVLKETLDRVRMRAVLDSLVIKLARDRIESRGSNRIELSEIEKSRLIAYMQDPSTSAIDFRDGARILSAHLGPWFFQGTDPQIDDLLKPIFSSKDFDNEKRLILLEFLKNYLGMTPYAKEILENFAPPARWKRAAFFTLARYDTKFADQYAELNLLKDESYEFQLEMAMHLARSKEKESMTLDKWLIKQKKDGNPGALVQVADAMIQSLSELSPKQSDDQTIDRAARLLYSAITAGMHLNVCDRGLGSAYLCFTYNRASVSLNGAKNFFSKDRLLKTLMHSAKASAMTPEALIQSLTARSKDREDFSIRVKLNSAIFTGKTFGKISADSVNGDLTLYCENSNDGGGMYATFRSADGRWVKDKIIQVDDFYSAEFHFAYDEAFLNREDMQRIRSMEFDS
jgi:hypothetical protein